MTARGYQSYAWTTQDWRVVRLHKGGEVSYEAKCGDPSNTLPSGRKRLCLPVHIILTLLRTESGREVLTSQARKKQRAAPGQKVPWHPRIKRLHENLEKRTVKDKKKRRKR